MTASGSEFGGSASVGRLVGLCCLCLLVGMPGGVVAQEAGGSPGKESGQVESGQATSVEQLPEADKEELLRLLEEAKAAYADGRFRDAIPKLKEAYAIYPDPQFQYRIALSYERSNQVREAIERYERFLEEAPETEMRGKVERTLANLRERVDEQASQQGTAEKQAAGESGQTGQTGQTGGQPMPSAPSDGADGGSFPVVLTAIGGVSTAAAVTFGVLNLNTRQQRNLLLEGERSDGAAAQKEKFGRRQNLYAGLTYGSAALAAASFTGVAIALITHGQEAPDQTAGWAPGKDGKGTLRVRFAIQPGWFGLRGDF